VLTPRHVFSFRFLSHNAFPFPTSLYELNQSCTPSSRQVCALERLHNCTPEILQHWGAVFVQSHNGSIIHMCETSGMTKFINDDLNYVATEYVKH
jgi:hypothetical protein